MAQITIEVPVDMEQMLGQLTQKQQRELSEKLWAIRIECISNKMRAAAKKNKVTRKDIIKMCKDARKQVCEKHCHRH